MRRQTLLGVIVAGLALTGTAAAQNTGTELTPQPDEPTTRVATRGANFLLVPVGARGQALAGAYAGLASGVTAMYWNPAGVATADVLSGAFSRSDLYGGLGIQHTYAGFIVPFLGGGLGLNYTRLDSGDIPRTDEDNPDGGNPQFGETFTWAGTAVGITYGRRLTDRLAVGGGAKVITEGMSGAEARWWALDVGTQFNTGLYGLRLGAALSNIGSRARMEGPLIERRVATDQAFQVALPIRFATTPTALPTAFRFSVVSEVAGSPDALTMPSGAHRLRGILDFYDGVDTDLQVAIAAEYNYRSLLYLRAGKRFMNERDTDFRSASYGLSWGFGVRLPVLGRFVSFDYAHSVMGDLDNVQTFSFEVGKN